ncbi:MAG: glycosyltransferase [Bacteroidales bacterium]|nr:glycosyltransferase [Bacteroidales bacterium]
MMQLIFLIVLVVFGLTWLVQLIYYWAVFSRLAFYRKVEETGEQTPVSVVISAKDEYHNLKKNLRAILEQDHPDFEVVVVNDASDDETAELLKEYDHRYDHLNVVTINQDLNFFRGKKFPLSIGIKSAKNEIILLTDADCKPYGNKWIAHMQKHFSQGKEINLGYSPYRKYNSLLNVLIRFDTFHIGLQYLSFALAGMPYMGVGRNLAYKKGLFYKTGGFVSHYKVASGDDDLFINQVADKKNTAITIHPESLTISEPKRHFGRWFRQKKRHLSTGKFYRAKHKWLLGLYSTSQLAFFAGFVLLLIWQFWWMYVLGAFAIRLATQMIIFGKAQQKLQEKSLLILTPFLEVFFIVLNPVIAISNIFRKPDKW